MYFSDIDGTQFLQKNENKLKFAGNSVGEKWFFENSSATFETFYMTFEEKDSSSTLKYNLLQWGTQPNELGLIARSDNLKLDDARFHWKITNPFDAMLFKYLDKVPDSSIMYDFGGPYEFRSLKFFENALKLAKNPFYPSVDI